jgi:hypothetical protein
LTLQFQQGKNEFGEGIMDVIVEWSEENNLGSRRQIRRNTSTTSETAGARMTLTRRDKVTLALGEVGPE